MFLTLYSIHDGLHCCKHTLFLRTLTLWYVSRIDPQTLNSVHTLVYRKPTIRRYKLNCINFFLTSYSYEDCVLFKTISFTNILY